MRPAAFLTLLFSLAGSTLAKVYIYKPVESSHYQPGESFTVSWRDDGTPPSWEEWGPSTIGLYTGSATSQTLLTTLGTISDPSKSSEHLITIDGQWGGNSSDYFIRIESTSSQNPETDDPLQAFSARFTLSGMTGKFSEEVEAQLAGATGATASSSSATEVGGGSERYGQDDYGGGGKGGCRDWVVGDSGGGFLDFRLFSSGCG
ncbi:hypothetical protein JCM11641_001767 [Rhodosporidiobolus odoratus]